MRHLYAPGGGVEQLLDDMCVGLPETSFLGLAEPNQVGRRTVGRCLRMNVRRHLCLASSFDLDRPPDFCFMSRGGCVLFRFGQQRVHHLEVEALEDGLAAGGHEGVVHDMDHPRDRSSHHRCGGFLRGGGRLAPAVAPLLRRHRYRARDATRAL